MNDLTFTSETHPITADMLPIGPMWEADGACWKADLCGPGEGCEWRWHPLNEKALAKNGPEGEMTDHYPLRSQSKQITSDNGESEK